MRTVIRLVEFSWILSSKTRFSEVYRPAERCGLLGHLEKTCLDVEGKRRCPGRLFQMTGAATWKLR